MATHVKSTSCLANQPWHWIKQCIKKLREPISSAGGSVAGDVNPIYPFAFTICKSITVSTGVSYSANSCLGNLQQVSLPSEAVQRGHIHIKGCNLYSIKVTIWPFIVIFPVQPEGTYNDRQQVIPTENDLYNMVILPGWSNCPNFTLSTGYRTSDGAVSYLSSFISENLTVPVYGSSLWFVIISAQSISSPGFSDPKIWAALYCSSC